MNIFKKMIRRLFWLLPYNVRRRIIKKSTPDHFQTLQNKRTQISANGYSYQHFVDNKCIFVHIPKVAGIAVNKSLFNDKHAGHDRLQKYQIIFDKHEFDSFYKFAFVRNPWDRLVSAYEFLCRDGFSQRNALWYKNNLSKYKDFNDFVKHWLNPVNIETYWHFVPQYRYVCLPYQNKPNIDFIGYFETFEEDYEKVRDRLKIGEALKRANVTKGRKKDYTDYYSDETRKIVEQVYAKDIKMFGYTYDNAAISRIKI